MAQSVTQDRKSPDVRIVGISKDETSCAHIDPKPSIPKASLSIIAASFAGGQASVTWSTFTAPLV